MGIISVVLVRIIEGSVVPKKTKSDLRGNKNIDLVGGAITILKNHGVRQMGV